MLFSLLRAGGRNEGADEERERSGAGGEETGCVKRAAAGHVCMYCTVHVPIVPGSNLQKGPLKGPKALEGSLPRAHGAACLRPLIREDASGF
jgi:hypothetical protein